LYIAFERYVGQLLGALAVLDDGVTVVVGNDVVGVVVVVFVVDVFEAVLFVDEVLLLEVVDCAAVAALAMLALIASHFAFSVTSVKLISSAGGNSAGSKLVWLTGMSHAARTWVANVL
jgi:hypothetical protein